MLKTNKFLKFFLCLLLLLATVLLYGKSSLQKLTFVPQWQPQAQFAGYYVAQDLGIYQKYGLDVKILPGGPDYPSTDMLRQRKVDVTTVFLATAITEKEKGLDLINIGQTSQMSSMIFVAKKSSGIRTVADLNGKKIGIWRSAFQEIPLAFLEQYHIKATIIPIEFTVDLFTEGGIDVMAVEWYNEYHQILSAGYEPKDLVTFFFYDHHLNISEDGIYCMKSDYYKNPDKFNRFVKASMEGWSYAFSHPEVAVKIAVKYKKQSHLPANLAHERWMLNRMKDIMEPEGKQSLKLRGTDFSKATYILLKHGIIKKAPTYRSFVGGYADASK